MCACVCYKTSTLSSTDVFFFFTEFVEDVDLLIRRAERCLEAGADMIMLDADDVCRQADSVRADIIAKIIGRLGLERTMFEASNPRTSEWFINQYGPKVYCPFCLSASIENDYLFPWVCILKFC